MSDTMLHGVLCMPPELWHDTEIDRMQRYQRYVAASRRIEEQDAELTRLRAELAEARKDAERITAAVDDAAYEWSKFVEADHAPMNLQKYLAQAIAKEKT